MLAAQGANAPLPVKRRFGRPQALNNTLIVAQGKTGIKAAQGLPAHALFDMVEFGLFGAQEFTPGRGVKEQIPHFHGRSDRVSGRRNPGVHFTAFDFHPGSRFLRLGS